VRRSRPVSHAAARQAARENLDWFWGEIDRADDLNVGHWIASFWPDIMLRTMRAFTPLRRARRHVAHVQPLRLRAVLQ
jgi:hypothetical protein